MDPRRVIAHLDPQAVYARQWDEAKREADRRHWAPFNEAMKRFYLPAIRRNMKQLEWIETA
jgi:hypothetical protein